MKSAVFLVLLTLLASSVFALNVSNDERLLLLVNHTQERLNNFYGVNNSFFEYGAGLKNYFFYNVTNPAIEVYVHNHYLDFVDSYSKIVTVNGTSVQFSFMDSASNYESIAQFYCKVSDYVKYPVRFKGPLNYSGFSEIRIELVYACIEFQEAYEALLELEPSPTPSPSPNASATPSVSPSPVASPNASPSASPVVSPSPVASKIPSPSPEGPEFAPGWDPKLVWLVIGVAFMVAMLYVIGKALTH
ncbi:MAG: hypothetical protein V1834_00845 [Candidatus Micrarchaeota archaeon]